MKKSRHNSIRKKAKSKKLIIRFIIYGFLTIVFFIMIFIALVRFGIFERIPDFATLKQIKNNTATEIISVDGQLLGRYYYQNRTNTSLSEIPQSLINALIATEDARFYKHKGVDARSMFRVFFKTILLSNRGSGGGSTISQQLSKNLYPRKNHGIFTMPVAKVKEMIIAKRIEKLYSKQEILELYLNTVPFGENSYGIETAALIFFNKRPAELEIQESAVLIGLLKGNTSYNPLKKTEAAIIRRNIVIDQMVKYNYLNAETGEALKLLPLRLQHRQLTHDEGPAPYFREHLRHEVTQILKDIKKPDGTNYNIYADGMRIYTTINARMQLMAEKSAKEHMSQLQKIFDKHWKWKEPWKRNPSLARLQIEQSDIYKNLISKGYSKKEALNNMKKKHNCTVFSWEGEKDTILSSLDSVLYHFKTLQTGVLVMNAKNGDILVWVGGSGYKHFKYDHVKAKRQAGSTFKPIVYTSALENGKKPCDYYKNDSIIYEDYNDWCPQNANHKYGGYYSMKGALIHSVNTVSAQLILETGIDKTIDMAHRMGIESELPEVPSLALGTGEVSLFEMVNAYCVFLNEGRPVQPRFIRRIEDAEGKVVYADNVHVPGDTIISPEIAQEILAMMKGVIDHGTAYNMRNVWGLRNELAGKTGTTQNHTDGWFIVMNPKIVVGTWVGGDNPVVRFRSLTYGQGSYMALPIAARFLNKLYTDPVYKYLKSESFNIPEEIYTSFDCKDFNEDAKGVVIDIFNMEKDIIQNFIRNLFKKKKRKKK